MSMSLSEPNLAGRSISAGRYRILTAETCARPRAIYQGMREQDGLK